MCNHVKIVTRLRGKGLFIEMLLLVVAGEKFFCRHEQEQLEERIPEKKKYKKDSKVVMKEQK